MTDNVSGLQTASRRIDASKAKEGDPILCQSLEFVQDVGSSWIRVLTANNYSYNISSAAVDNTYSSAVFFEREVYMTRTALSEMLDKDLVRGEIFTVCFEKEAADEDIDVKFLKYRDDLCHPQLTQAKRRKLLKRICKGKMCVLRGRKVPHREQIMGRTVVEDLDIKKPTPKHDAEGNEIPIKPDFNQRQVDHRTLQYLICEGVKYIVK